MLRFPTDSSIAVLLGSLLFTSTVLATPLLAQDVVPLHPPRHVTAGERTGLLRVWQSDGAPVLSASTGTGGTAQRVPGSEVRGELRARAQQWAQALGASPGTGLQLDAAGELFVAAGEIEAAQSVFAQRLATPGLSLADSAYTLELAVSLFARGRDSARLRIAEAYQTRLAALPATMSVATFRGYMSLAWAYYYRGDGDATASAALNALALVDDVGFAERRGMVSGGGGRDISHALTMLGEVWSVDTTRRATLDSVGQQMLALMQASPAQLAADTRRRSYAQASRRWTQDVKQAMAMNALVGQSAPPLVATHWYLADAPTTPSPAAPGARALPTGDGVIRVIEFGGLGCSACLAMLPVMERVRDRFADAPVEVWYLSQSEQRWGATESTPDEAAEHIYNYYIVHHGSTVPMGVWAPPVDDSTREAGAVLARENPNFAGYHITAIPVFVVIDGQGRVRRMIRGGGPVLERTLTQVITYLLAESAR